MDAQASVTMLGVTVVERAKGYHVDGMEAGATGGRPALK